MNTTLLIIAVLFAILLTMTIAASIVAALIMTRELLRIRREKQNTRP